MIPVDKPPEGVSFPIDITHLQIIAFAKAMDEVLVRNDHKGGWQYCGIDYLQARLIEELGEYFRLVATGMNFPEMVLRKKKELLDIANFAMMLWDRG